MKVCSRCDESKPLTEYYLSRGKPTAVCKVCVLRDKREERERFNLRTDEEIDQAAAARGRKRCSTCTYVKDVLTEFPQDRGRADGRSSHCLECNADKVRDDRVARREVYKKRRAARYEEDRQEERRRQLRFKFGITPERYWEMHAAQGGVCAICDQPETRMRNGRLCDLAVDHDHTTGAIRQLLCNKCNTGIGWFRDSPELMQRAALYVQNHNNVQQRESPPA